MENNKPGPDNRDAAGRFGAGNRANPGGRSRAVREALEAFRNTEDLVYIRGRLREIMASDDLKAALGAIKEWNDRAYGRPPQAITGEDGAPIQVGANDLHDKLAAILARAPK